MQIFGTPTYLGYFLIYVCLTLLIETTLKKIGLLGHKMQNSWLLLLRNDIINFAELLLLAKTKEQRGIFEKRYLAQEELSQIKSVQQEFVKHSLLTRQIIGLDKEIERIKGIYTLLLILKTALFVYQILLALVNGKFSFGW